jgi:hypothetical protein
MKSFEDCLEYLRTHYQREVQASKLQRDPEDQYREKEFYGFVDGPNGRMDWNKLKLMITTSPPIA